MLVVGREGNNVSKTDTTPSESIPRRTLSAAEVARTLGVSLATVNARIADGTIPSLKLHGRRLVRSSTASTGDIYDQIDEALAEIADGETAGAGTVREEE